MSNVTTMQQQGKHPETWDDFVGQDKIKQRLRTSARASVARSSIQGQTMAMEHMLIVSPEPGSGKTSLALLAAKEANAQYRIVKGVLNEEDAMDLIMQIGDGGVLIWDECHQGFENKRSYQWLYQYLQQGVFLDGDEEIVVPRVTIIGATTHVGQIPAALMQRFSMLELERYNETQATNIAYATWEHIGTPYGLPTPSEATCTAVARAASGRARFMQRIWEQVVNLALTDQMDMTTNESDEVDFDLTIVLQWCELTPDGLTMSARAYMLYLIKSKDTKAQGRDAVSRATGIMANELTEVEQLLMDKGYLKLTGSGRALSHEGRQRAYDLQRDLVVAA